MNFSTSFIINGERDIELTDPRVTLLDLLRERLNLTGTKKDVTAGKWRLHGPRRRPASQFLHGPGAQP